MKKSLLFPAVFLFFLLLNSTAQGAGSQKNLLRMALLPIPDVLPVFVAEENNYFNELGIAVQTLAVGSGLERDQLMQAGRIDGMINEISGAAMFNRKNNQLKIIAIARSPLDGAPLFRILGAPGSGISSIADLAGVPVGISKNTVIEYISDRLLGVGGVESGKRVYKSVPVLPERLQLLLSGQIKAATLPDPLGISALTAGAVEIINDTSLKNISCSVISFSTVSLTEKQETVKKFMVAWDRAVTELNADPDKYRGLMLKKIRVPKNVQKSFAIPPFPVKAVPTRVQWDDVMDWMVEKKLLSGRLEYEDSVTSDFLAK
jgi:NitT/TauT family transport system substrate-binding protein